MADARRLIAMSRKAGKADVGEQPVLEAIAARKTRLVLISSDAADNTVRRMKNALSDTHISSAVLPYNKDEMGALFGRQSCAVCAVSDIGFCVAIAKALCEIQPDKYEPCLAQLKAVSERIALRKEKKPGRRAAKKEKNKANQSF